MAPFIFTPLSGDTSGLYTNANGVSTRYVKVTPPPQGKLYISQVLVIDSRGINVAFQKETFTTDTSNVSNTYKAVDGKYEQSLDSGVPSVLSYENYVRKTVGNSFVTTTADKYWIVDLGKEYSVNSVIFVAAMDPAADRGNDSKNAVIELFNTQLNRVGVQLISRYVSVFGVDILDFRRVRTTSASEEGSYLEVRPRKIAMGCTGCGIMTQYIRIEGANIRLSQIIVMDPNGRNIALYMPTYSGTDHRNSYKVVDGKYYTKLEAALNGESEAFIGSNYVEVNFGAEFEVVKVFLVPTVETSTISNLRIKLYNEFRDVIALLDPSVQTTREITVSLTGGNNIVFPSATNVIGVSILRKYSDFLTQAGQMSESVATAEPVVPLGFSCGPGQALITSCADVPLLTVPRFTRGDNGGIPCRYIRVYNLSQ
jgi:hypothetical protein